jgi:asparaginyl-tRNA synthetase
MIADNWHLVLCSETASAVLWLSGTTISTFPAVYTVHDLLRVTQRCIVQTQVDGGATLFKPYYYGQEAHLTQSSLL